MILQALRRRSAEPKTCLSCNVRACTSLGPEGLVAVAAAGAAETAASVANESILDHRALIWQSQYIKQRERGEPGGHIVPALYRIGRSLMTAVLLPGPNPIDLTRQTQGYSTHV